MLQSAIFSHPTSSLPKISPCSPGSRWMAFGLWASKSEGVGLSVHAVSFQDFQSMWSWSTNVTDGRTTCDRNTALCTIVHRAVKNRDNKKCEVGLQTFFRFIDGQTFVSDYNVACIVPFVLLSTCLILHRILQKHKSSPSLFLHKSVYYSAAH